MWQMEQHFRHTTKCPKIFGNLRQREVPERGGVECAFHHVQVVGYQSQVNWLDPQFHEI